MKTFHIMIALVVLGWVAFEHNCFAEDRDAGISLDIKVGAAVFESEGKEKPERDYDLEPVVFTKIQYTFDGGNQIYIGTIFENDGEPTVGATFGKGLVDISAFYITPVDVYKDPFLTEREETTEAGLGGKIALSIKSFKAAYEVRYTEVADDEIAKRFKELSRDVLSQTLSASYEIDVGGLFSIEPKVDVTFAINRANKHSDNDEWAQRYSGARIGFSLTKTFSNVVLNVSAKGGENHYVNEDPVFNTERVDAVVNMKAMVAWLAPFGHEKYSAMVIGGADSVDSSIEFYDRDEVYGGVGVGYHF